MHGNTELTERQLTIRVYVWQLPIGKNKTNKLAQTSEHHSHKQNINE